MKRLLELLAKTPERSRLILFGLCGVSAAVLGFFAVKPPMAAALIQNFGYYYILGVFGAFCYFAYGLLMERKAVLIRWLRHPGLAGAVILLCTLFLYWSDPFKHKILFDEYVLQGTAYHLHETKEIGAIVRAYDLNGTWLEMDTFLDKRPYFFAFLVSLLHDLTGYRIANMFIVNALLGPLFLGLLYWLTRELAGKAAALVGLVVLTTLPLLGQNVTCAGMELHNLTMLILVMVLAVLYLRVPNRNRLSLLVLGTILLSQSRYESVIFVLPSAIVILIGWVRSKSVFLSWPAIIAPFLLVPYAWHNRVLSTSPLLWQLNAGQTSRFSLSYFSNNIEGAKRFFFSFTPDIANSWYLSILGILGFCWFGYCLWKWLRIKDEKPVVDSAVLVSVLFGIGIAGNLGMLMFYYWSRLDDVIASRFALPMCMLMAMAAAAMIAAVQRMRIPALRIAIVGLGVWFLGWGIDSFSEKRYTNKNLVMQEIDWEHEFVQTQPGQVLFISNMSTIPFILWKIPSVLIDVAVGRSAQVQYHLHEKTFSEILVAQELVPTSASGDMGVDPKDMLPDFFKLKTLKIQRFGNRWTRISRVIDIEIPVAPKKPSASVAVLP